jgi:D-alanyl-lipoteichoic acid acyltransferase DltB (MBOAT superfamily)
MLAVHYVVLRQFGRRPTWHAWIAFGSPIAALVAVRYLPFVLAAAGGTPADLPLGAIFVGLSYMAFRLSYLVLEVRNGTVPMPRPSEYIAFAMFVPTFMIGPISRYHSHWQSRTAGVAPPLPMPLLRILVGTVKYFVLGNIVNQTAFRGLLLDGHPHPPVDPACSYHLYLYCNFGHPRRAIGAAALGIRWTELPPSGNPGILTVVHHPVDLHAPRASRRRRPSSAGRDASHAVAVSIAVVPCCWASGTAPAPTMQYGM